MQPRGKSGTSSSSGRESASDFAAATAMFCSLFFGLNIFLEALSIFGLSTESFFFFFFCGFLECGAMSKRFLAPQGCVVLCCVPGSERKKNQGLEGF